MLDADLAQRLALLLAGGPGELGLPPSDLIADVDRAAETIARVTGLEPEGPVPSPEWVDRATWAQANLTTLASVLDPLAERVGEEALGGLSGPARAVTGLVASAEAGALMGVVGRRVLGQYDVALLDPTVAPRLLFVAPNLADVAGSLDVDHGELVAWVAFHEVTHAVQFAGVPWLRGHLAGLLRELLEGMSVKVDPQALWRLPSLSDLRALAEAVREGGLALAVAGPERRALLERVQAVMGLVEGHAEWAMDAAGREALPSLDRLREALDTRRRDRPPALRLLDRLIGLDLKLRQYEDGRRFCDALVAAGGEAALRRAWASAQDAPDLAELREPRRWLARQGLQAA
jgi:coenzyme F420 biosynthesis associated uncharacterized protein